MSSFSASRFWQNYLRFRAISGDSSTRGFVDALLFWHLLGEYPRQRVLEIGCFEGLTTTLMLDRLPNTKITCVDIEDNLDIFREIYSDRIHQVSVDICNSTTVEINGVFDFVFVDGDHGYDVVRQDLDLAFKHMDHDSILAIDDYSMPGVAKAIDEVYQNQPDWVPFLQGIQTQFWHHRSKSKDTWLDNLLTHSLNNFVFMYNIQDRHNNTVLRAHGLKMLTDNYHLFDLALDMYPQ